MNAAPHRQPFHPHPLTILAASFALGILVARLIPLPFKPVLASGAACTLAAVLAFTRSCPLASSIFLALALCCSGAASMMLEKLAVATDKLERLYDGGMIGSEHPVEVTGVVERAPEQAPEGFYLTVRAESLRFRDIERDVSGNILLFAPVSERVTQAEYEKLELRHGARVRVMTALSRTVRFRNPGVSPLTEYLERRGLDATGMIKSPLLVERLDDASVFLPLAYLYEWRQRLLAEIDRRFSAETSGVLKAALLGNRYQLSRSTSERFREGGTFHALVISGMHISFIGGVILFLMRRVTRRRMWQFAVSVTFLWAYTLAVGAEVSVVRAAVMFTMMALAPVLQRRSTSLNALGGATLLLLIWEPADLFNPSFQLTFLSVLAIVALGWPLLERLRNVGQWRPTHGTPYPPACSRSVRLLGEILFWSDRGWRREMSTANYGYRLFKSPVPSYLEKYHVQRPLRYAFTAFVISTSVQLMLVPLQVIYFHRISFASLVLNIVIGALMALLSLVALAALLLVQITEVLGSPLFKLAEGLNWLMVHSVDPFTAAGVASMRLPEYTGWASTVYFVYYIPLAALALALVRWAPVPPRRGHSRVRSPFAARPAAALFACLLSLIIVHPFSAGRPDGRVRIDFLDVGQGDAALITMPDGATLLVDGGGRPRLHQAPRNPGSGDSGRAFERDTRSIGEAVVSEYLWWRGLDRVDYILGTHAHADHLDGLNDVARNFRVRAALVARTPLSNSEFEEFLTTADKAGVPVRVVGGGDILRFGMVEVDVLWPPRADQNAPSDNDASIVLRLRFGARVFLLTGDIEKDAEAVLSQFDLRCDVVKVAHHGSKTSSTDAFVKATRPGYAVFSAGPTSMFGHPHAEVVKRWRESGAEILTTGQRGTITVSTDGSDLRVETYVK